MAHTKGSKICRYCNKAFERPSDLARHEERHLTSPQSFKEPEPPTGSSMPPSSTPSTPKQSPSRVPTSSDGQNGTVPIKTPKSIKFFQCDGCVSQFTTAANLKEHKSKDHSVFCARLDEFKDNELCNTSILKCELGGNNEITLCMVTVAELSTKTIPSISSVGDMRSIIDRPQDDFNTDREAMMRKGGNIWVKHFMRSVTSKESTDRENNCRTSTGMLSPSAGSHKPTTSGTTSSNPLSPSTVDPQHVRSVEAIFRCTKCNYITNVRTNWDDHQRAHEEGRYICKICGKDFLKCSDLTRHWVGHVTVPGNSGLIQCQFKSADKGQLEGHMRSHYISSPRRRSPPKKAQMYSPDRTAVGYILLEIGCVSNNPCGTYIYGTFNKSMSKYCMPNKT